jgi:hypothetical protein
MYIRTITIYNATMPAKEVIKMQNEMIAIINKTILKNKKILIPPLQIHFYILKGRKLLLVIFTTLLCK